MFYHFIGIIEGNPQDSHLIPRVVLGNIIYIIYIIK
jgi:hypothetical protein